MFEMFAIVIVALLFLISPGLIWYRFRRIPVGLMLAAIHIMGRKHNEGEFDKHYARARKAHHDAKKRAGSIYTRTRDRVVNTWRRSHV